MTPSRLPDLDLATATLLLRTPTRGLAIARLVFAHGIVHERQPGAVHVLAEMLMRGTRRRSYGALLESMDDLALSFDIHVGHATTTLVLSAPEECIDAAVALVREVFDDPLIDDAELDRLLSVLDEEASSNLDDTDALASLALRRALWPAHRPGLPVEGTPGTRAGLDVPTLRRELEALRSAPSLLCVAHDAPGAVAAQLSALRGGAAARPWQPGALASAPPRQWGRTVVIDVGDLETTQVQLVARAPQPGDADFDAATLHHELVAGGASGALFKVLRGKLGLSYTVESSFEPGSDGWAYALRLDPETRRLREALAQTARVWREAATVATATQQQAAVTRLRARRAMDLASPEATIGLYGGAAARGEPFAALEQLPDRVAALPLDALPPVAERWGIGHEQPAMVLVGPAAELPLPAGAEVLTVSELKARLWAAYP